MRGDVMNVWNWIDNLARGLKKVATESQQNYQQIHAYVDGHDKETLNQAGNLVHDAISEAKSAMDSATAEIQQANKQISLKADQTEVDQVKQTASQNSSRLDVMAGQISSKVTSTDVNNIVDKKGYTTTSTVQSLIAQKAGTINESITSLDAKYNATVTQAQSLTASIDGLQSTVANKADKSQITQLSNAVQSKVSTADFNSKITQLSNDINLRVTKGDLLGQINVQAGKTLIQNGKIYLDASSIVFGKNSNAIIPNAAIGNLNAAKITMGAITVPMSDAKGKATVKVKDGKVIITGIGPGVDRTHSSPTPFDSDYIGQSDVTIDHEGISFDATVDIWNGHPGTDKALGVFRATSLDTADTAGLSYVVKNLANDEGPKNAGDFFAVDRQGLNEYEYIHGIVYKASEDRGSVHLGTHFYDPVYIHPYGAETGIRSTWCSWSSMGNRKLPVLVNSDHGWSGIAFPAEGQAFVFSNNGYVARPNQKIDSYSGYGEGNRDWRDPSSSSQADQTIDYSKWA